MPERISLNFLRVVTAVKKGEEQQALLERTLGRGLLEKMTGRACSLSSCYKTLGGADPGVLSMLEGELDDEFQRLPVGPGVEVARKRALSSDAVVAAGAKNASLDSNVLATYEGQALKTLADLGGDEFAVRYRLDTTGDQHRH